MGVRKNQNKLSGTEKLRYVEAVKRMKRTPSGITTTEVSAFLPPFGEVVLLPAGIALSVYDKYPYWHISGTAYDLDHAMMTHDDVRNHAHRGAAFLPWHRFFLYQFERDLQEADLALRRERATAGSTPPTIDRNLTIPFWDWTHDNSPDPRDQRGSIWKDDFMGPTGMDTPGAGGRTLIQAVPSGPFSNSEGWILNIPVPDENNPASIADSSLRITHIQRRLGEGVNSPSASDVDSALSIDTYDVAPWDRSSSSFRNAVEGALQLPLELLPGGGFREGFGQLHDAMHAWVGGTMGNAIYSAADPVFFLHHCFIDRIWAQWQDRHPGQNYPPSRRRPDGSLRPASEAPPEGQGLDDIMYPWVAGAPGVDPAFAGGVRPRDVLFYRNLGFEYGCIGFPNPNVRT